MERYSSEYFFLQQFIETIFFDIIKQDYLLLEATLDNEIDTLVRVGCPQFADPDEKCQTLLETHWPEVCMHYTIILTTVGQTVAEEERATIWPIIMMKRIL